MPRLIVSLFLTVLGETLCSSSQHAVDFHIVALVEFHVQLSNTSNYCMNLFFPPHMALIDWGLFDSQGSLHGGLFEINSLLDTLIGRSREPCFHFAFVKELLFSGEGDIIFPAGDLDTELNELSSSVTQLWVCLINSSLSFQWLSSHNSYNARAHMQAFRHLFLPFIGD